MPSLNEPVPAGSSADVTLCWKLRRPSEAAVEAVAVASTWGSIRRNSSYRIEPVLLPQDSQAISGFPLKGCQSERSLRSLGKHSVVSLSLATLAVRLA